MMSTLRSWLGTQRAHIAAAAAILAFTIIFFSPLFKGRTFSMVGAHMYAQYPWLASLKDDPEIVGRGYPQTDNAETFYPANVFATHALRSGQFPMWLPYSFSGVPIMEIGLGDGLLYPPKLATMFHLSPIRQRDFIMITHLLLAGLGMYALLSWWGAGAMGSVFGAIAWELSGHAAFWLTYEHAAIAAAWLPLSLLCAEVAIRRRSMLWAVGAGTAAGMSLLGFINHVYAGLLLLTCWYAVISVVSAWRLVKRGQRRMALSYLSLPLLSAIVAAALSAASWLALLDLIPNASRQPSTLELQSSEGIPSAALLRGLIRPESADGTAGKLPDVASLGFVGVPALILAFASLLKRSQVVFACLFLCLFSLGIALGLRPLLIGLRFVLPFFGAIHPYTGLYLFSFGAVVLSAFGLTEIATLLGRAGAPRIIRIGLGCLVVGVEAWQLIAFAWTVNPQQPVKREWLFPETPLITELRSHQGEFHILPVRWKLEGEAWTPPVLSGKTAACFDLRSSAGYESLLPVPTATFWRTVEHGGRLTHDDVPPAYKPDFFHDRLPLGLLEKASVGLLAVPPGVRPLDITGADPYANARLALVYQGPDGWIYRVTRSLPRVFLVSQITAAADPTEALAMLVDESFDASKRAVVIGEEGAVLAGLAEVGNQGNPLDGSTTISADRLNEVTIDAVTSRSALLVLNDSWDAGWKAYVDGIEKPLIRVNYAFRGVVISQGQHRVSFLYRPTLLMIGLFTSASTLVILVLVFATLGCLALRKIALKSRSASDGAAVCADAR